MEMDVSFAALGCAVLHSLWELTLLGLLAWITLRMMARYSARFRYGVALGFLALMVLAMLFTLVRFDLGWSSPRTLVWVETQTNIPATTAVPGKAFTIVPGVGAVPGAHPWIGSLSALSGSLWLLGCLLMSLRLSWIWFRERRLFDSNLLPVEEVWINRLGELRTRMGLRRKVILRATTQVGSPMTWGWLKPIVLLPASSFLNLSPDALEAVLVHELAHVRRLDYLAGLLQSMAEVLLFYHPALWLLSRQIRELRELCCDDAVMELLGDPLPYAEGLVSLERHRLPRLVQASQRGNLMFRINRMLNPDSVPPQKFSTLTVSVALFLASGLAGSLLLAGSRGEGAATTTSQSVVFSYSIGSTKALRIEGYDIVLAKTVAARPDNPDQTLYNHWNKANRDSSSAITDWTIAQLRLRMEALRRGEKPTFSTFEAPPNDSRGRPQETPLMSIDMAKPHRLFAIDPPLMGHSGAITLHLETLDAPGPITPEREQAILKEALELMQAIRGEGYAWTDTITTREAPPPTPVVELPLPAKGTFFLISTGESQSLRMVGFENLIPTGEFDINDSDSSSQASSRMLSQIKAIWSWAQTCIHERVKALEAGQPKPLVPFSDLPLNFGGFPQDSVIFSAGDATALKQGQPGQLFSIHRAQNGQRISISFRLPSLAAFKGRMPSKEEEVRMLQEALGLLEKQQRGEVGECVGSSRARAESISPAHGGRKKGAKASPAILPSS